MARLQWIVASAIAAAALAWAAGKAAPAAGGEALLKAEASFAADSAARGAPGWLDHFAPDAAIFPPGEPVVEGKTNIQAFYAKTGFSPEGLTWAPRKAVVAASGDLGYTYGTWGATVAGTDGKPSVRTGKYLTVWRKQPDGSWKVVADIGNADPAKAAGP